MSILPDDREAYRDKYWDNDRGYNLDDIKQIPVGDIDDIDKLVAGKSHSSHSPQERELEEREESISDYQKISGQGIRTSGYQEERQRKVSVHPNENRMDSRLQMSGMTNGERGNTPNTLSPAGKNIKFNIPQLLSLSHQQLCVFICKTAGLSNRESAKLMNIREVTVREYWKTVKKKLNTLSPEAII